jgi:hypothetical protein
METFVIRVFVAADAQGVPFCGVVEHAGRGRAQAFQSTNDLIHIVVEELAAAGQRCAADEQEWEEGSS